ncbi:hypothetical protein UFOVP4_54 [uncultured Caudovirales phage]|uniref:Uncharacterized protein n=1 Tax=uncultured Caudovirales phage TaxID=2100421 RepID=A0A6J5T917_9CAUD|nr:hypothetical protein UFOVP4_54 [uncultured Caudovirales phage]CAB4241233.1 hypothetical protein UFOVP64_6 [uncultured Caudovirales phage]CAB5078979.1 hypothetical protein UFOVP145_20 [uncultured Caudovirales phage]
MMDFSQGAGQGTGNDLIPNGQLAWVIINVRGLKSSQSGGQYVDVELTLDDNQPFSRRKIWEMIGDPMHPGNSEAYRQMGMVAISRILESAKGAGPQTPGGYKLNNFDDLHGLRVPIRIGIAKGTGGYADKNRVGEWLTPNPQSQGGFKDYQLLASGVHSKTGATTAPVAVGGFGVPQAQPQASFTPPQPEGTLTPAFPTITSHSDSWLQQANT